MTRNPQPIDHTQRKKISTCTIPTKNYRLVGYKVNTALIASSQNYC